jgi:NADH dehydrogenase
MILIAGGTGRLGTLVVNRLVTQGRPSRVLTRDPARAAHLAGNHVEVVTGDVGDPDSLQRATAGVDIVVSAVHGFTGTPANSLETVDHQGNANLIDAAKAAGASFVLMSTVGAAADSPMELFRMKYAAEQHVIASGIHATILRATAFLELWIELLQQTASRSGRPLVFGSGNNPINFVSVTDVAALVARAIDDPGMRGETLEIGGPDNLTFNQLARAVQTAGGRDRAPRHVPPLMLHLMANTIGRVKPQLGRQARAALVMDQIDLSFDAAGARQAFSDLPTTDIKTVLEDHLRV